MLDKALLIGCSLLAMLVTNSACATQRGYEVVNLLQLLTQPEKYDEKWVMVSGYFSLSELYLSSETGKLSDRSYAINILDDSEDASLTFSSCNDNWVRLTGKFIAPIRPETGKPEGRLIVDYVKIFNSSGTCWRREKE